MIHRRHWLIALVGLAALAGPSAALATDFYVDTYFMDAHDHVLDGHCDATAGSHLCTLRAAIEEGFAAAPGDTVIHLGSGTIPLTLGALPVHEDWVLALVGDGPERSAIVNSTPGGSMLISSQGYLFVVGVRIAGFGANTASAISIATSGGTLVVDNAVFEQNRSAGHGASIEAAYGADLTVRDTRFVQGEGGYGEVQVDGGYFDCDRCTFEGATGEYAGALHLADVTAPLSARIANSTFTGNRALQGGGAIRITNAVYINRTVEILNTTIVANSTEGYGGGILMENGLHVSVRSSTIAGNLGNSDLSGGERGGGIALVMAGDPVPPDIDNSIISGNLRCSAGSHDGGCTAYTADDCSGTFFSNGYNIVRTVLAAQCTIFGGYSTANPLLLPLAYHGGSTRTLALPPASPARDAGDPAGCLEEDGSVLLSDQRDAPRPPPGTGLCDLGAFEYGALIFDDDFEHWEWKWTVVAP
jgi:hypothetical protein